MPSLEEVLAGMPSDSYLRDDIRFVIDENLRTISVPGKGAIAGVVGDKDVNRINFKIPRKYNGFDLSTFSIRINYTNASNHKNYYPVDDLTIGDNEMLFSWLLAADVFESTGAVSFTVRMIKTVNESITNVFNTTPSSLKVLEGMDVTSQVPSESYTDSLTQIQTEVRSAVSTYLSLHPELTSSVQNGSLTDEKFSNELKSKTIKDYATPEMYGAVGNGTSDDGAALRAALEAAHCVVLSKTYHFTGDLILNENNSLVGYNGTLDGGAVCMNRHTILKDVSITNGHIELSTEKVAQSFTNVTIDNVHITTSDDSAILFDVGGSDSNFIYDVTINNITMDGTFNYGIRSRANYNSASTHPWLTTVNISNIFMNQFKTGILFDYTAPESYSFATNVPWTTNCGMSFVNVRGQWYDNKSDNFIEIAGCASNIMLVDCYPFDYDLERTAKSLIKIKSYKFADSVAYTTGIRVIGANPFNNDLYSMTSIESTTDKAKDFYSIFGANTSSEEYLDNILWEVDSGRDTAYPKDGIAARSAPVANWKDQPISNGTRLMGVKMLHSDLYGGVSPIIGANNVGIPFVASGNSANMIFSSKYMPVFYSGNEDYPIPTAPCAGYVILNNKSHKPMWYGGPYDPYWRYADGTLVPSAELL